jgi:hypothetical protein
MSRIRDFDLTRTHLDPHPFDPPQRAVTSENVVEVGARLARMEEKIKAQDEQLAELRGKIEELEKK